MAAGVWGNPAAIAPYGQPIRQQKGNTHHGNKSG